MAAIPLQPQPGNILFVRLGAMGDVLHAMPAVAAIRNALPNTRLGWVIERRWAELLLSGDGSHATCGDRRLVDALHVVDTLAWRKRPFTADTWYEVKRALGRLRTAKYELALDVQGAAKSAVLARASGARLILGFEHPREQLATIFYSKKVIGSAPHVIEQNLELCSAIAGAALVPGPFDLPRSPHAERWCDKLLGDLKVARFAILNPGSGWGAKCWPADRFAEVARRFRNMGLRSIVNIGPGEQELAAALTQSSDGAAQPVSCSMSELVALARRASLFIGGDTGPMHLAAALHIPVVALFGPTDPARNGPYGAPSVILRSDRSVTSYSHVADADPGLQSITADEVISSASKLLGVTIA